VLRLDPGFACRDARKEVIDPVLRERQLALLREAGLPDMPEAAGADAVERMLDHWIKTHEVNLPPHLNADALATLYAEDCINIQPLRELPNGPLRGREAMRRFLATFDVHWSTMTLSEVSRLAQGRRAVWEAEMEGIHRKTGKLVKVPIVFFFDFDDEGRVKVQHTYIDNGLVEEQVR
jgi:SnoaL-like domain